MSASLVTRQLLGSLTSCPSGHPIERRISVAAIAPNILIREPVTRPRRIASRKRSWRKILRLITYTRSGPRRSRTHPIPARAASVKPCRYERAYGQGYGRSWKHDVAHAAILSIIRLFSPPTTRSIGSATMKLRRISVSSTRKCYDTADVPI